MQPVKLRPYQHEAVEAIDAEFAKGIGSTLIVQPTGTGKTVVFTEVAHHWREGRVLVICPQIELIDQAARKIQQRTGEMPGIEQGPRRSNESWWGRSPFVVSSKQTLTSTEKWTDKHGVRHSRKRYERIKEVGLVIIDEAHYAITSIYKDLIKHFQDQGAKVLGVTATPHRADGRAMRQVFETCCYKYDILQAIDDGWLVGPKTHCLQIESLDLSGVKTTKGGDFHQDELGKVMEDDAVVYEIAELVAAESRGLKTVVYCQTVAEARKVANLLADQHGYKADWISGACSNDKRSRVLRGFTKGNLELLTNVGVLTTGWDFPGLEHIVTAAPTKSLTRYMQILGRGMRPLEGVVDFEGSTPESRRQAIANSKKPFFKVTDLRDNSLEHKLVSVADVLGGSMTTAEMARVKKLLDEAGEARPLGEVIAEAKAAQAEAERLERERLAQQRAKAKYAKVAVDPFDTSQRGRVADHHTSGPVMKFGKYKGTPMADVPEGFLTWAVNKRPALPKWMTGPCWAELKRRRVGGGQQAVGSKETPTTISTLKQLLLEV